MDSSVLIIDEKKFYELYNELGCPVFYNQKNWGFTKEEIFVRIREENSKRLMTFKSKDNQENFSSIDKFSGSSKRLHLTPSFQMESFGFDDKNEKYSSREELEIEVSDPFILLNIF